MLRAALCAARRQGISRTRADKRTFHVGPNPGDVETSAPLPQAAPTNSTRISSKRVERGIDARTHAPVRLHHTRPSSSSVPRQLSCVTPSSRMARKVGRNTGIPVSSRAANGDVEVVGRATRPRNG